MEDIKKADNAFPFESDTIIQRSGYFLLTIMSVEHFILESQEILLPTLEE